MVWGIIRIDVNKKTEPIKKGGVKWRIVYT